MAGCDSVRPKRIIPTIIKNQTTRRTTVRFFSYSTTVSMEPPRLPRVAIVGAGVSGLSAALHLAPLVSKGLIAKPIHVYEKSNIGQDSSIESGDNLNSCPQKNHLDSSIAKEHTIIPFAGTGAFGRDIGVGIWNTALEPLKKVNGRKSHLELIDRLEKMGQYVGEVGYRTPKGKWLTKSKLYTGGIQASPEGIDTPCASPSLLFIRERDFLSSLRDAVRLEQDTFGTIQMHYGLCNNDKSTMVQDIVIAADASETATGKTSSINPSSDSDCFSGKLKFGNGTISEHSYHLIIAADGMNSLLRTKYGGYDTFIKQWKSGNEAVLVDSDKWKREQMHEKHSIEDRKYVVFRGNSPLTDKEAHMNGMSFQTWGEGKNMRFAAVGMSHPLDSTRDKEGKRCEKQVWFATITDDELCSITDPQKRKERLLESFRDWHDPICSLIESTPATEILMERGVGHKHSLLPVLNLADVIQYKTQSQTGNKRSSQSMSSSQGPGPILLFLGDAYMTIDPVLAQGFTMGMEGAADLASTLEKCLEREKMDVSTTDGSRINNRTATFDSDSMRRAVLERNSRRFDRVMCLIRSTELVQYMAQPTSALASMFTKHVVRPFISFIPSSLKEMAFSEVMKYSLGYYHHDKKKSISSTRISSKGSANDS